MPERLPALVDDRCRPGSRSVSRAGRKPAGSGWPISANGPAAGKVDVLLISERYAADELPRFHADAARLVNALFDTEPFKSLKADFNVRALDLPGRSLSVEYGIFGLARYLLTYDNRRLRDVAASAPYEVVEILLNDEQYGGGGIFNLQSTVAAGTKGADYVFIHEFAHNLAGLGDEYVGNVTYETGEPVTAEPWEPNLTALLDPPTLLTLKWRDLIEPGTPLPTPMTYAGKIGAFEGGGYQSRGLYRPEADCIMFSVTRSGLSGVPARHHENYRYLRALGLEMAWFLRHSACSWRITTSQSRSAHAVCPGAATAAIAWTVTRTCSSSTIPASSEAMVPVVGARKFFYLLTCEYCFSHYVAAGVCSQRLHAAVFRLARY